MAMTNLDKAIRTNHAYCTINSVYSREWRNFTLQKGHIFGYSPELKSEHQTGLFVVYQVRQNNILLYVCDDLRCEWYRYAIEKHSTTGKIILAAMKKRIGGVTHRPLEKQDIKSVYNPPVQSSNHYTPMRSMRIPMGSRGHAILEKSVQYPLGVYPDHHKMVIDNIKLARGERVEL